MADLQDPTTNPLLKPGVLPAFSAIKPEHVEPAVRELLATQRAALAAAERVPKPDLAWLRDLERISVEIDRVWGPVYHLNSVVSSPPLRDAFNRCLPLVTEFGTELGQNTALYRHFDTLQESVGAARPVEQQLIANALRDFRLGGVTLEGAPRERFREVMQQLAAKQATFEQNVMDATDAFEHRETDRAALAGLPEFVLERARALATERGFDGWCLRLDPPTYQTVLAHAESVALREKYYQAWVTRASDQGPHAGRWDNSRLIEEIMALRHEAAQLVGFKTFAEYSLASKMAESPQRVIEFLRDLARRSLDVAREELAQVSAYAGRRLESWDVAFYAERLKQEKLGLAEEELRPYFPLPRVLEGLFTLCARLFDLNVAEAAQPDVWHESVRYYELRRADGTLVGSFFTDLFARPNKRGGAWMGGCVSRANLNGHTQLPVAHLVCNFNAPAQRHALIAHALRGRDAVPRIRPHAAPRAHGGRLSVRGRHERRRVGRGRAAEPIPRELLLAPRGAGRDRPPLPNRRAVAAREDRHVEPLADVPGSARRWCGRSSSRCSTSGCTTSTSLRADRAFRRSWPRSAARSP